MKSLPKLLTVLLFCGFLKTSSAQVESIPYYDHINFNNSFYVIAESDAKSNYYALDLSRLASAFEKEYFNHLVFTDGKLVRIDAGNENIIWIKVKKIHDDADISALFQSFKTQAVNMAASMNEFQKQEWLSRHGK